jgi:hypothetical protein
MTGQGYLEPVVALVGGAGSFSPTAPETHAHAQTTHLRPPRLRRRHQPQAPRCHVLLRGLPQKVAYAYSEAHKAAVERHEARPPATLPSLVRQEKRRWAAEKQARIAEQQAALDDPCGFRAYAERHPKPTTEDILEHLGRSELVGLVHSAFLALGIHDHTPIILPDGSWAFLTSADEADAHSFLLGDDPFHPRTRRQRRF